MFRTRRVRSLVVTLLAALLLLVFATAASAAPAAGTAAPAARAAAPAAQAQWTFAIYCDGDNSLEQYWEKFSLPWLLDVPASPGVNIVAMIDRLSTAGTELVEIDGGVQHVVATYPEKDFGDGATFAWFLQTVRQLYPSTHLAVTMWDHGWGWQYIAKDDTSGGDGITMDELGQALNDGGGQVDILSFDACNMGDVAVAWEIALTGKVGITVASEESVPYNGFPYDKMLTPVAVDPARTPAQVASDMVAGWKAYYDALTSANTVHLAAVDVSKMAAAMPHLQRWSARLAANLPAYRKAYDAAMKKSWGPWATRNEDLGDLCGQLNASAAIGDATLKRLSRTVRADLAGALIAQDTAPKSVTATGLTIWWGQKNTWTAYGADFQAQVSFAQPAPLGVGWWAFLEAYNTN